MIQQEDKCKTTHNIVIPAWYDWYVEDRVVSVCLHEPVHWDQRRRESQTSTWSSIWWIWSWIWWLLGWCGWWQTWWWISCIHPKSWFHWFPETADKFEFSAERLSENVKTINSAMCVEITVKRHLPYHSTLIYIHYLAIVLVAINTLLDLFWHFVFKWRIFLKFD